ncbi:hypothetical protein [Paraburkholderia caffeinilytica]|uniref:hypothetical protein n=1 Tax=Paraburkholderia caffeinilytica TaxID=1761016 RepID=UPI0038BB1779
MNEHPYCEDHDVKLGERLRELLVAACESAKPVQREKLSQRVNFTVALALVVRVTGARAVLAGRLRRASIQKDRDGPPVSDLLERWFGDRPFISCSLPGYVFRLRIPGGLVKAAFHHDPDYSHFISRRSRRCKLIDNSALNLMWS